MATEILRPNGASTEGWTPSPVVNNYLNVDETVSDGDTTYVAATANNKIDQYELENSSIGAGTINSVTFHMVARYVGASGKINLGYTVTAGSVGELKTLTGATVFTEYTAIYTTEAFSGIAWTWAQIDEIRLYIRSYLPGSELRVTQVWAVVDYEPVFIYPTYDITRVTSLIHRYNRAEGIYNLEIGLGETDVDIQMPDYGLTSVSASPVEVANTAAANTKDVVKKVVETTIKTSSTKPTPQITPITEPGQLSDYAKAVLKSNPYVAAALTQQVNQVPSRPTVRAYTALRDNEQAAQRIEENQATARLKTGNIATERTKAIITSSPAAQKRLAEMEEDKKSWWQKLW